MNVVITWMYSSPQGENILHNQVGRESSSNRYQDYYWRCVFLLFESSHRLNSEVRHILFVNKRPPAIIDGVEINVLIQQFRVEVVMFDHLTLSPGDYHGAWNTQFLVLDVLDWVTGNTQPDDAVFILDSDIVFINPLNDRLLARLADNKALLYSIDMPADYMNNGLTAAELLQVARALDDSFEPAQFVYSGGEFICLLGSEAGAVSRLARETYESCLDRHRSGLKKFNEEAHLLSFVYQKLGYPNHSANDIVRRIWTDRSTYCNVVGDEDCLVMWHLPAEKKAGFVKRFRSFRRSAGGYALPEADLSKLFRLTETVPEGITRRLFRAPARRALALARSWSRA